MCRKGGNSISRAQSSGADAFWDRPAMQNRTNLRVGQKHHLGLAGVRTTELEGAPTRSVERVMGRPGPTGRILRRDHQVGGGAIRERRQGLYTNGGRVASVAVAEGDGNVPYCGWGEAGAGRIGARLLQDRNRLAQLIGLTTVLLRHQHHKRALWGRVRQARGHARGQAAYLCGPRPADYSSNHRPVRQPDQWAKLHQK